MLPKFFSFPFRSFFFFFQGRHRASPNDTTADHVDHVDRMIEKY